MRLEGWPRARPCLSPSFETAAQEGGLLRMRSEVSRPRSLPRLLEIPQIRGLLALFGGHQQAISTHHIVLLADANVRIALGAVPRNPHRARVGIANVILGHRPGTRQRVI